MSAEQVFNPFLPSWEYIPDGEPHVFGDRLYLFGSHDRFGASKMGLNDYTVWSAPVGDLSDWRMEGVTYRKTQDPANRNGERALWAPDVARGKDGKYYLYYCLADYPRIGVAVCDEPAGKYEFLGYVRDAGGSLLGEREGDVLPFDPAVLVDDDGQIYLYAGSGAPDEKKARKMNRGSVCVRLANDMMTMLSEPVSLIPTLKDSKGTGFEGHEMFEASSIRKFEKKYYFIYSSIRLHELVYAVSDRPDGGFSYRGVLVSNGDIPNGIRTGFNAAPRKDIYNYIGNNHGSVVKVGDKYYVFYHRQTNRYMSSRQACAEEIAMTPDGEFRYARLTSCGLNGGPLRGKGTYGAYIACHLQSAAGCVYSAHPMIQNKKHPAFTQTGGDREENPEQYISNMREGSSALFRSFFFAGPGRISVKTRGKGTGSFSVLDENGTLLAEIPVSKAAEWTESDPVSFDPGEGEKELLFVYHGKGSADFLSFRME